MLGFAGLFLPVFLIFYIGLGIKATLPKLIYTIALICFLVGILFKIMHWPIANELLIGGVTICFLIAGQAFMSKRPKNIQDYLLIIWFALATIHYLTLHDHSEWKHILKIVSSALLTINILYAIVLNFKEDNA